MKGTLLPHHPHLGGNIAQTHQNTSIGPLGQGDDIHRQPEGQGRGGLRAHQIAFGWGGCSGIYAGPVFPGRGRFTQILALHQFCKDGQIFRLALEVSPQQKSGLGIHVLDVVGLVQDQIALVGLLDHPLEFCALGADTAIAVETQDGFDPGP